MTKEEAIKKLKEAKELRDLEVISSDVYNSLLKKYKPLLLDEESSDNTIPSNHSTYVPKEHKSVADNNLAERQKGDSTSSEGNTAARSKQNNTTNKNSNQNTTGTILWLIFFFPVGLYKMWNRRYWTKRTRWIITIVCIVVYSAFYDGGLSKKADPCKCSDVYGKENLIGFGNLSTKDKKLYNKCQGDYYNPSKAYDDCVSKVVGY